MYSRTDWILPSRTVNTPMQQFSYGAPRRVRARLVHSITTWSPSATDFRGLRHLRDKLGERFKAGVLLHTGRSMVPFGDRLAAVPLCGLWAEVS